MLGALATAAALAPHSMRLRAAVIVPGFLNDANDYAPLAKSLTERGIPAVVVPMPIWHWIPSIGGRSVRPICERIDHAVRHVSAMGTDAESSSKLSVPPIGYTLDDLIEDFKTNPGGPAKVGGSELPKEYPDDVTPRGTFPAAGDPAGKVALIGCSAGGYMARIYLSSRSYAGRAYRGSELVHSLVTLGTPHLETSALPFINVKWANEDELPEGVRVLAVGARGTSAEEAFAGAYAFCDPSGNGGEGLDGDGVTTSDSALALPGAETVLLDGVTHYPWTTTPFSDLLAPNLAEAFRGGMPWYGSWRTLDEWVPWLLEPFDDASTARATADAAERAAEALVRRCALERGVPAEEVLRALEKLEGRPPSGSWDASMFVDGASGDAAAWELVWSSAVAGLPIVGGLLRGYFPTRETLRWDIAAARLDLEVETIPFVPAIKIEGTGLVWDAQEATLTYSVNEKPKSTWTLLLADVDAGVIAARSSVTGLNIIRRVHR